MSGIVGFTGVGNSLLLRRMCQLLSHRGPDEEGTFEDGQISMAARRLAVVDPVTGRQPATNENGNIWVAFNGEIYNHVALRRELEAKGHRFRSHHSDTEVAVHLYEEKGERWADQVNGMFGVAIWDAGRQRLSLYRDRIGEKPLYFVHRHGQIMFASEIKALLAHPTVSRAPDWQSLYHYFGLKNTVAPRTAYQEVRQLLPGQYLVWERGVARTARYWQPAGGETLDIGEGEASECLLKLLDDAVDVRMKCDAPFGAHLSGDLDSSTIVSLMGRHQSQPVTTFSVTCEDDNGAGRADRHSAREIAKRLGTDHHEYRLRADEIPETLPDVLRAFDEPFSGNIGTYFLSTLIHDHAKVALSGDGANGVSSEQVFDESQRLRLLTPEFLERVEESRCESPDEEPAPDQLSNQVLPFVDRLSMAHSIEVREPFLDSRIVDLASRLPEGLTINSLIDKHVLKQAVGDRLPLELARPNDDAPPVGQWIRQSLRPYVEGTLQPDRVARHGLLCPKTVSEVVALHYEGGEDRSAQVWNLVCFQVWWETCMAA